MAERRKSCTFIWKIKNFRFNTSKLLRSSPAFFDHAIGSSTWYLELFLDPTFVDCFIQSECNVSGHDKLELDLEISVLAGDGSVLQTKMFLHKVFPKNCLNNMTTFLVKKDEIFPKKDLSIPDDTLTIRFRMWDSRESFPESVGCFAETRIGTEKKSFVGIVEKFSYIEKQRTYNICIKSSTIDLSHFPPTIMVEADGLLYIDIKLFKRIHYYICEVFILDRFGNKVKFGEDEFTDAKPKYIPLVSTDYLMKNKEHFLPDDELSIHWDIIFPKDEQTHKMEYKFDYQETQAMNSNTKSTGIYSEEEHVKNLKTLKDDWISLFNEGILCDTKLKTATDTFPVHMAVLSARSSVFKSMFNTDMKEKTSGCVDIDDLDSDTVRRMLLFMYSATIDELEYESAKSLYFAADKYNIVSLRQICSSFLKKNLLLSNCCDILLIADKHQDKDLKDAVQDYIAENDETILFSDKWRNLEENNCQLIVEVFRSMYMKRLQNKDKNF